MHSILRVGRELTVFVILNRKKNCLGELHLNAIRKDGWQKNSWSNDWEKPGIKKLGALVEKGGMLILGACKGYLTEKVKT